MEQHREQHAQSCSRRVSRYWFDLLLYRNRPPRPRPITKGGAFMRPLHSRQGGAAQDGNDCLGKLVEPLPSDPERGWSARSARRSMSSRRLRLMNQRDCILFRKRAGLAVEPVAYRGVAVQLGDSGWLRAGTICLNSFHYATTAMKEV